MGSAFVTSFFSIPWSSFLVSQFGVRIVFIFATFVAGFANTLFGFISYTENATLYFWVSLFLRMFCAVGESLVASTAFTFGSEQFTKDRQGIAMSMVETSFGIGLVVGPSLGGLFHNYWGFSTPFWTLGVLTLVLAGFSASILKPSKLPPCKQTDRNRTKWTDVLYCPNMLLIVVVFLITGNSAGFYSASLEPYLAEKFDLTPGGVGLVLMGFSITYTITNPIVGVLLDSGFAPLRIVLMGKCVLITNMSLV
ncbi:MFS-type transporter SLC18B1 isoform X2 [Eurytemora carolleeae]|nr:MFS-type transporter SLC18B1 isoform X2 [Eurytemora carolleeae]|eukprot:XP_023334070.1 MFS-type transporter SLC18B1-like isoform X2 [Eurytemora affinis]